MLASKLTKTDQCYSNISVIFVTLLLLQVLQFKIQLKRESVDFPGSTVHKEERFLYPCLLQRRTNTMYFDQLHNCSHQLNSVKGNHLLSCKTYLLLFLCVIFSDCVGQKMFVFHLIQHYGDKLLQL